jgi:hypothetical protein
MPIAQSAVSFVNFGTLFTRPDAATHRKYPCGVRKRDDERNPRQLG